MASTLRLNPEEKKKLDSLKKIMKQATDSGIIKEIICNYEDLYKRFNNEITKREHVEELYSDLQEKVQLYFDAEQDLKKMLSKTSNSKRK